MTKYRTRYEEGYWLAEVRFCFLFWRSFEKNMFEEDLRYESRQEAEKAITDHASGKHYQKSKQHIYKTKYYTNKGEQVWQFI